MNTNELKNLLVEQLSRIDGRTSPWSSYEFNCSLHGEVYPELRFFDDINSFPAVCFVISNERIIHAEGGARFYTVSLELRGYTYDEDVEESGELLAEDVEHVLAYLRQVDRRLEDVRLLEINTDAGINAPWGACILNIEALFRR